jgi:hypothetical protein
MTTSERQAVLRFNRRRLFLNRMIMRKRAFISSISTRFALAGQCINREFVMTTTFTISRMPVGIGFQVTQQIGDRRPVIIAHSRSADDAQSFAWQRLSDATDRGREAFITIDMRGS